MRNNNSNNSGKSGIGFFGVLQVAFIVLKIIGMIDWPWGLVFIPIYIELGLTVAIIGGTIGVLKFIQNKDLRMIKKAKRIAKKKSKTYYKGNSNKENKAVLEKYKNDTLPVQSMILEGAPEQDIIQLKSSKEYKEQESNKNNYDSEIMDIVDYINMNVSMSNNERKKLLLKFKRAYISNKTTLAPIKYAENVADSYYKEKKLGTR